MLQARRHSESHNSTGSALQMPVCLLDVHWHFVAGTLNLIWNIPKIRACLHNATFGDD